MSAQANALRLAGANQLKAGQVDQAIATLRQALQADPESFDTFTYLGFALTKKGDVEAARRAFGRAVQIQPASGKARYNLGMGHQLAGDIEAARVCFSAAVGMDPGNEQAKAALEKLPPPAPKREMSMSELSAPGGAVRLPGAHTAELADEAVDNAAPALSPQDMAKLSAPQGHIHLMGAQADDAEPREKETDTPAPE